MNPNSKAIRILCYGDSNTWGQIPITKQRYPADVRWTGLLQKILGDRFEVIEEGLGSRTTRWEYSEKEGRNGRTYLLPCLESHNPLDIVILFLGTNDLKEVYQQSPRDIVDSIRELIRIIKEKSWNANKNSAKILLTSPAMVDESVPGTQERYRGAQKKSLGLAAEYQRAAKEEYCFFMDVASLIRPSQKDGVHFEVESHAIIANSLAERIREML